MKKHVFLIHVYKNGIYVKTSSIAFTNRNAAENYANKCIYYAEVEKVELLDNYEN